LLVAAVLVVAAVLREGGHDVLLLVIGAAALAVIAAGLVLRWSGALALGVALLGAQQATRLALGPDALDQATPLVAGALLLGAELAWWSIEPRVPAWSEPWLSFSCSVCFISWSTSGLRPLLTPASSVSVMKTSKSPSARESRRAAAPPRAGYRVPPAANLATKSTLFLSTR